jgi:adenosylmethionine-8-amino-7-oxononanoate aminotransferase
MTGFGRTGKNFATGHLKTQPDIICLSKGITGGTMPLGVTSCNEDIYASFLSDDRGKTFYHGHSYTANPVACAAAIASYDLLCSEECQQNIQTIAAAHELFIKNNRDNAVLKNLRSTGTILAMDFQTSEPTSYFHSLRDRLYHFFLDRGIILRPLGNTVYVMPPYCISKDELRYVYDAIEACADELY